MDLFGVGLPELIVIFVVALLVFGPRKLPEISKTIAKTLKGLQDASRDFQTAFYQEADELERSTRSQTTKSKSTPKSTSARRSGGASTTTAQATDPQDPSTDADSSEASLDSPETAVATADRETDPEEISPAPESQEETEEITSTAEMETVADLKQDTPEPVAAETDSSTPKSSQISAA